MQNKNMKKAFIKTILESSPLKNKPNFIDNFLKASEKTSMPMFEDPRPGNVMNLLPEKDKSKITHASSQVHYQVKPGRLMFFPSYMPHQYIVDMGYEPFRFIHFNCQAIPNSVLNV